MVVKELLCRWCDTSRFCQPWTVYEREVTGYKSDVGEYHMGTDKTGQCDDCRETHGADEYCSPPDEQDEAQARAEAEYRDRYGSEL